jgi:hypothetical protein
MTYSPATLLTHEGVEQPIREHALDYGIPSSRIIMRLVAGWSVDNAISRPVLIDAPIAIAPRQPSRKRGRPARTYTHEGLTLTIREWAEHTGITKDRIHIRMSEGMTIAEAIAKSREAMAKAIAPRTVTFNGETLTIAQWAKRTGVPVHTLHYRFANMTIEEAVTRPYQPRLFRRRGASK